MDEALKQQLILQFNLAEFSEAEQEQILSELSDVVTESVLARTIPQLFDEDGEAVDMMLGSAETDMSQIFKFIAAHVPNFQSVVDEEIANMQAKLNPGQ